MEKWQYAAHQPFSYKSIRIVSQPPIKQLLSSENNLMVWQSHMPLLGRFTSYMKVLVVEPSINTPKIVSYKAGYALNITNILRMR